MIVDEIEENPNCRPSEMMRFRGIGPPRKVTQVRLYHEDPAGRFYRVTGWTDQADAQTLNAFSQPVEDSGSGTAYILYGGNCGLRFKPASSDAPWSLTDPAQWGEPFLLLGDPHDLVY